MARDWFAKAVGMLREIEGLAESECGWGGRGYEVRRYLFSRNGSRGQRDVRAVRPREDKTYVGFSVKRSSICIDIYVYINTYMCTYRYNIYIIYSGHEKS